MKNRIKKTDKDYIVIVNHPLLQKRAEELGYQAVNYFPDTLRKSEYEKIRQEIIGLKKTVFMALFHSKKDGVVSIEDGILRPSNIHFLTYDMYGWDLDSGKKAKTVEEVLTRFPPLKRIEDRLSSAGYIRATDYEERCGNCRAYLDEDDKYCKYCGTKRGEGAFLPYNNKVVAVIYGPPLFSKTKYKCSACGTVNIVPSTGSRDLLFCPKCGQKQAKKVKEKIYWQAFLFIPVGTKAPYDEDNRPVLFSEETVKSLLNHRTKFNEEAAGKMTPDREILSSMQAAGLDVPRSMEDEETDEFLYPITETEHEQMVLAYRILHTKGNNWDDHNDIACPYCGSKIAAALEYTLRDEEGNEQDRHVPLKEDALLYHPFEEAYDKESGERPAYLCLCCGTEFGSIIMRNEKDESK